MKIRILAVVAALLAAGSVQALPTVSIIWKQTGTDTINANSVAVGQLVNANIVITADVAGAPNVIGVFGSGDFNNTKLDITCGAGAGPPAACGPFEIPVVNLPGMGNTMSPISASNFSINQAAGVVQGFDQAVIPVSAPGLEAGETRTLGSLTFEPLDVSGNVTDVDVVANVNNTGVDGISRSDDTTTSANFESAAVVPEPLSSALGGAALLTLLGLKRRRSRT